MADVDTRPRKAGDLQSPNPAQVQHMYRMIIAKVRLSAAELKQYRLAAGKRTMSAFIRECVEAAIIGKVDQSSLNEHLFAVRKTINAASEAATIEEARRILVVAKLHINELRGI
jgi:hypothetical protein